jgi:hypothetical protein
MAAALVVAGRSIAGLIIHSRYSTSASLSSTDQLTIYQLQTRDCLQGSGQILINFNQWNGPFTAAPCAQPHTAEVFFAGNSWPRSLAYPGDQVAMATDMRAASRRSEHMTESTIRGWYLMLWLLLQTAAPGLVVTGGWCVSPPRPGRWTIRSEAAVSNGGLCPLQAPGRRNDSSAEVQHAVLPDLGTASALIDSARR